MLTKSETTAQQPLIIPEESSKDSLPPQIKLFNGQIILNPTISKLNFFTYLLNTLFIGIIYIPINLLQSPLLSNVYNLDQKDRNNLNSQVQLYQLIVKLLLASWLGYICDKYSRKFLIGIGVLLVSSTVFCSPNLPNATPWYALLQLAQELGFMCISAAPLLADYIDYETKGRVAGLIGVLVYTTSFIATLTNENINLDKNVPMLFHVLGVVGLILGLLMVLGLKGGAYHKKLYYDRKAIQAKKSLAEECPEVFDQIMSEECIVEEENAADQEDIQKKDSYNIRKEITRDRTSESNFTRKEQPVVDINQLNLNPSVQGDYEQPKVSQVTQSMTQNKSEKNFKPGFMAGIREAKNPWILVSYICGLLMISNVSILNYSLVSYITSFPGPNNTANQAYALTNKHFLVGAFTAMFFGFYSDKYNKFKLIIFVLLSSVIGVILLIFTPTPTHAMAYISMVLFGISCSGFVTATAQLQSKYANPKYRASVTAVGGMCAVLGSASINILGVYLMTYNVKIPFYIYLGFSSTSLVVLMAIYASKKEILNRL